MYIRTISATVLILLSVFLLWYGNRVHALLTPVDDSSRSDEIRTDVRIVTPSNSKSKHAGGLINYTALGDSITAGVGASTTENRYVDRLGQFIADDAASTVAIDNRGVNGMTSGQLLTAVQNDAAMRASLQNAQIITFGVGSNDLGAARSSYLALACGGLDNQDCLRAAVAQFKANWNLITQEILALRANAGVSVRAIDLYYPTVQTDTNTDSWPADGGLNDFQVLRQYIDEANLHTRATTLSNGVALGRVHRSINGPDGMTDPGFPFQVIAADLFHPNDRGHSAIADRLHFPTPICMQPQIGLRAWYRAEGNGNDSTTNNNHGTLENGTLFVPGKSGQALSFDGVDDSVLLPSINLGLSHTVEMWINPAPTQSQTFVHLASNDPFAASSFGALGLFTDTPGTPGNYGLRYAEATSTTTTPPIIPPNVWTHIAIVRTSGDTSLYVDGILSATGAALGNFNNPLRLGSSISPSVSFYSGKIDEAVLYDRALSGSEIASIVDADSAGRCVATDLQIAPTTANLEAGSTQTFTVTGGTSPYFFSISSPPPSNGSLDGITGVYTATNGGIDTVSVIDSTFSASDAIVTVTGTNFPCPSGQKVWDGGGTTDNWSDAGNWCDNTLPTASSAVLFDSTSVKNAAVDMDVDVASINIAASYTGSISVNALKSMNFSSGSCSQAGGAFSAGDGGITFGPAFTLSGGIFSVQSGTVNFNGSLNQTGGTFNNSSLQHPGNVNFGSFSNLTINGGTFNAPTGTLTLNGAFNFLAGIFNHRVGTVVFAGNANVFLGIAPGEIVFHALSLNKSNGSTVAIFPQTNAIARVIGTLTLTEGLINGNTGSAFRAEGAVNISPSFGDQTLIPPGGNGILQFQNGPSGRVVSVPAGASLPNVEVDDADVTINGTGAGLIKTGTLKMSSGVVNMGATNIETGVGGGRCFDQNGGTFTIGSGNFLCDAGFVLSGTGIFTGGSGNFTLESVGNTFQMTGGTFTAPTGTTLINTGVVNANFTQSAGTFNSNGTFDCQCASFALSGGTFNATAGTSTFRRNFNRSGGTFNANGGTVVFTATPGGGVTGNTTFQNLTVDYSGATHNIGGATLTVLGDLNLQNGDIDQPGGTFDVKGNVTVGSGFAGSATNIAFTGNTHQTFTNNGGGNPSRTWTINKPSGTLSLNSDLIVNTGVFGFDLTSGNIATGTHLVDIGARPSTGGSSSYVIGNLRRSYPGGSQNITRRYDIGTTAGYAPVTVRVPSTPGPISQLTPLRVSTVQTPHPLFDPTQSLNYYWVIGEGTGLSNTDITFVYPQAAVNGNEANYLVDRIENGQVQIFVNPITITTNTVLLTGINNFAAEWTISEAPPPLVLTGPNPATVNPGDQLHYTASGGRPPYEFDIVTNNSGATRSSTPSSTFYTAGPTTGVTDTLRLTDSLGTTQDALITVVAPFVVINTNDSGAGSLRDAIANANNTPGTQTITFNIPGPPPYTITAVSPRRFNITDTAVIDGTSQPGFAGSPIVEVKNAQFNMFANNSTIKGLVINGATQGTDTRGILIAGNASGNIVQGNYIGTDVAGMTATPNGVGIEIQSGQSNVIGGSTPAQRNVISGNTTNGIDIFSLTAAVPAFGNIIQGNYIGVGADGLTALGNGNSGIRFDGAQNNVIGGVAANEGNLIANNVIAGISTSNFSPAQAFGNAIRGNSILANSGLGIDFLPNGVSANDACDADAGVNRRQNFPDLTLVTIIGGNTNIQGTLVGEANKTYTLDFYSNAASDEIGFGEGETYIGSGQVVTAANCSGAFDISLPVILPIGRVVTATATDPTGNTSEFSQFRGLQPADISGTILDSNNAPMKGVAVKLKDLTGGGRTVRTASTNKIGRFKFANVALARDYQVVPTRNNFVFVPANRTYNNVVTSHDDGFTGVVNSFTISGRLTMGGFTLSGATVTLSGSANATMTSNSSGDYAFSNLQSGTYTVTATKPDVVFTPPAVVFPTPITSDQTANFEGVSAALSVLPGRLVFADTQGIRAMNPDGTGLVTVLPRTTGLNYSAPRVSKDGAKLVFNVDNFNATIPETRISSADGSIRSSALNGSSHCLQPALSPDNLRIACKGASSAPAPLVLINADGTGSPEVLTTPPAGFRDEFPDWRPDGNVIGFHRANSGTISVWRVGVGSHLQSEVFPGLSGLRNEPRWSPDGMKFVIDRRLLHDVPGPAGPDYTDTIATSNADGTNLQTIVSSADPGRLEHPVWSPDGTRIAFLRQAVAFDFNSPIQLVTTLPDGSDLLVINPNVHDTIIDWGPDNSVATPAGTNTHVDSGRVHITFPSTSGAGATTITPIDPAAAGNTPGGFVIAGVAFEISSTATFTPPVEVCVMLTLIEPTAAQFNAFTFMHNEGGVMVDRTSSRDFPTRRICGSLPSFSPVALMKQVDPAMPTISGLVLDANGNPMNDVQVSVSDDETPVKTDFDGHFEFVNLNAGANYTIQAFKEGHLFAPPYQTFLGLTGDQTVVFTATPATFDIGGSVVNGVGDPISGIAVMLTGDKEAEVVTGADGTFSFDDLPANGSFKVAPVPNEDLFLPGEITVKEIQSDLAGMIFTQFAPTAAGVSIGGRVASLEGNAISGARLVLMSQDGTMLTARTGTFGYFRFDNVEVGQTYLLEVSHPRYHFAGSPRVVIVNDELSDIDFTGSPPGAPFGAATTSLLRVITTGTGSSIRRSSAGRVEWGTSSVRLPGG